jgi:hypothetical protein
MPDDQHFLVLHSPQESRRDLMVVQNFSEELKAKVGR